MVGVSNDYADTTYTYAPSGLRLTKTVDGEQIYYINDGDNVIAELYEDEVTAYYLRGLNLYGSFIGNDEYFYLYNAHGDVVNLTDTSGYIEHTYRYDAFGNEREPESSDSNPFRYCGEYYDGETGSYYLRARYYDPVVGRFTQQDSYRGDIAKPLSLNYYTYCYNAPIYYEDNSGNSPEVVFDVLGFIYSAHEYRKENTAENFMWLVLDGAALVIPFIPSMTGVKIASGIGKVDNISDTTHFLKYTDELSDGRKSVEYAIDTVTGVYRSFSGKEVTQMISKIEPNRINHIMLSKHEWSKVGAATWDDVSTIINTVLTNGTGFLDNTNNLGKVVYTHPYKSEIIRVETRKVGDVIKIVDAMVSR